MRDNDTGHRLKLKREPRWPVLSELRDFYLTCRRGDDDLRPGPLGVLVRRHVWRKRTMAEAKADTSRLPEKAHGGIDATYPVVTFDLRRHIEVDFWDSGDDRA